MNMFSYYNRIHYFIISRVLRVIVHNCMFRIMIRWIPYKIPLISHLIYMHWISDSLQFLLTVVMTIVTTDRSCSMSSAHPQLAYGMPYSNPSTPSTCQLSPVRRHSLNWANDQLQLWIYGCSRSSDICENAAGPLTLVRTHLCCSSSDDTRENISVLQQLWRHPGEHTCAAAALTTPVRTHLYFPSMYLLPPLSD